MRTKWECSKRREPRPGTESPSPGRSRGRCLRSRKGRQRCSHKKEREEEENRSGGDASTWEEEDAGLQLGFFALSVIRSGMIWERGHVFNEISNYCLTSKA